MAYRSWLLYTGFTVIIYRDLYRFTIWLLYTGFTLLIIHRDKDLKDTLLQYILRLGPKEGAPPPGVEAGSKFMLNFPSASCRITCTHTLYEVV